MRVVLSIVFLYLTFVSFSQIEMYVDNGSTDVSGTTLNMQGINETIAYSDIYIVNSTGESKDWVVTRSRINEQSSWSDYLCYGHLTNPNGGICFASFIMDYTFWTTTNIITANAGDTVFLQTYITPVDIETSETSTYRYYIGTETNLYEDSIDIEISTPLSINELSNDNRKVIGIYDLMGRKTEFKYNVPLIFLYDDGTREKEVKILI